MAGDYIKMDHELPDKAEVAAIFEATGVPFDAICGRLFLLWRLFDRQTFDGFLPGVGYSSLAAKCGGDKQFWESVTSVGWLEVSAEGARLPNFKTRFGETARKRMLGKQRAAKHRRGQVDDSRYESVTPALRDAHASVTGALPERYEKRTDDGDSVTNNAPQNQRPEPEPEPETRTKDPGTGSGVFSKLEEGDLKDDDRLMAWARRAAGMKRPVVGVSDRDLLFVFSAAERALEKGDRPPRLFASIVGKGQRELISEAQEGRGLERFKRWKLSAAHSNEHGFNYPQPRRPA